MAKFKSGLDYFAFDEDVKSRYRYVLSAKSEAFIRTLMDTMHKRQIVIPQATKFWRACLDHGTRKQQIDDGDTDDPPIIYDEIVPSDHNRLVPFRDKAREGRVNPKGIPCLYLADDRKTAMMEVRPWVGSLVTVAKFATKKILTLVDCSNDIASPLSGADKSIESLNDQEKEELVWWTLNDAFSTPVTPDENKGIMRLPRLLLRTFDIRASMA